MKELDDHIRKVVAQDIKVSCVGGKVKSVNKTKDTCTVDLTTLPDMLNVRLRAVVDSSHDGVVIYPKVGSEVLVNIIENNENIGYVSACSEIESVKIKMTGLDLEIDALGNVKFNNGAKGGLINITPLVVRINMIETLLNSLAAALSLPPLAPPLLIQSTIEDIKIKH